ncbi:DUF262 domain-containing protein [Cyanobacterium aponinum UTEX 3222]|uniref:GmrSD restriction endonuclease domain-containing protein n=1 Tax=Cyanobacterium aponinum TaxID=379064 RepID=UPI00308E7813|nr:DUF262 domain-containing protein [Cyanobacterium aponinum UTEX 3222]
MISDLSRGRIRIPSFQRGFVWEQDRVAYFIDSIYRGFPFGSALLWKTNNRLKTEKNLGPYKLPEPQQQYPIDYILDGQQRITSIFGIFQNELQPTNESEDDWTNLFFEMNSTDSVPFKYLDNHQNYDPNKYFPLKAIFDTSTKFKLTRQLNEDLALEIEKLCDIFNKAIIPVQRFESEEKKYVGTVFERVNRQGVELDTLQLLSAWNWSEDFDLTEKFKDLSEELESFGFKKVDSTNLLLKCSAAIIKNNAEPESFLEIPGDQVSQEFDKIKNGVFGTIDFLEKQLNIFNLSMLPMEQIFIVLSCFFASQQKQPPPPTAEQIKAIKKWFWRCCFSKRYSTRSCNEKVNQDLTEIKKLKENGCGYLGLFEAIIKPEFFLENQFNTQSIAKSIFILLLAENEPLNFIQGTKIQLDRVLSIGNKKEFHHIYPKAYLNRINKYSSKQINCLANFCILSRTDNSKIKDNPPHKYRDLMPKDETELEKILASQFCFSEMFDHQYAYEVFIGKRAEILANKAKRLIE